MRKLILAASLAAFAAPALAQPVPEHPGRGGIADALPHPFEVEEAGDRMGRAVGAILNVPVGDIVRSVDPRADVRRSDTIGDMARRDDPYFEDRIQGQLADLSIGMADMVRKMAVMAPVLQRSLEDLERNMADAMSGRGRGRDLEPDPDWDE